jgi:serine/threonine protein kinase/cephalosporin-C deacetylase-like acetyl esterase
MPASLLGSTIRHYQVLEELGRGGMGVVYKARDTKLNRSVALKFLPPHLTADEETTARFSREAQAAAAIEHPNICTIHEISETDDGGTYIVMGYYGGATLRERMEEGVKRMEEVTQIVAQILEGLSAAHSAGIVHRDIKPGNIILADDGRVRILDFGLAKLASGVEITQDGSTSGTAAYMSPEQINGDTVDSRSDLWSLGVILYEMLAGKRPFQGDYDQAISYAIVNKESEPVRTVAPDAPAILAEAVDKALKKDPGERFQSADEFIEALAPVTSAADGSKTFLDLSRQPKVAIPLAAAVLLLAFLGWSLYDSESKVRWARETALPQIMEMQSSDYVATYRLGLEAEPYLQADPVFQDLWIAKTPGFANGLALRGWLKSLPSGGFVEWKGFDEPETAWTALGVTPLDSIWVPARPVQLRISKEGFDPFEGFLMWHKLTFPLLESGSAPEDMVLLPSRQPNFSVMGLDHVKAQQLASFFMDRFEVTNRRFKDFIDAGGYQKEEFWQHPFVDPGGRVWSFEETMAKLVDRSGRPGPATWESGAYPAGQDDHPVGGVSWYEAAAFAEFSGRELPTIFHWSKVARTWWSYVSIPRSNFRGEGPEPVGFSAVGGWGTYDIAGNVREWLVNTNSDGERFLMGGAWDDPTYMGTDAFARNPFDRSPQNGFRTILYRIEEPNREALTSSIDRVFRDYASEAPVSDAEFESILRMYAYDRTPLNQEIESVDESNPDWIRQRITFDAAYGDERVITYVYLPRVGAPPYPTVVYFPGSRAIQLPQSEGSLEEQRLDWLLRDGKAVVYPIYQGTYDRRGELASYAADETIAYRDAIVMIGKDLMRSVDYIETRDDLDTDRLAYLGWSWGGLLGPIMTAIEPRFKVAIFHVAGLSMRRQLPAADPFNFAPRVKAPVLMLSGRYDSYNPFDTSQRPLFETLGLPDDQKRMVVEEFSHAVPRDLVLREAYPWLDRWLGER